MTWFETEETLEIGQRRFDKEDKVCYSLHGHHELIHMDSAYMKVYGCGKEYTSKEDLKTRKTDDGLDGPMGDETPDSQKVSDRVKKSPRIRQPSSLLIYTIQ